MRSNLVDILFFYGSYFTYFPHFQLILGIVTMSFGTACVGRVSWGILESKVLRLILFVYLIIKHEPGLDSAF